MLRHRAFPFRGAAITVAMGAATVAAPSPWRYGFLGFLIAESIGYQLLVSRFPIRVADTIALAAQTQEMHANLDGFVTDVAAIAADAVATVRVYDREDGERLEAQLGETFRKWAQ